MAQEEHSIPDWVVVGAGTGGTSATIGRYIRHRPDLVCGTRLCVVDPAGSAYFRSFKESNPAATGACGGVVEGIGRPRVEASFIPSVIDCVFRVPDAASVAACLWLETRIGRRVGPSTGTNVVGMLCLAAGASGSGGGSIVTLICDGGDRHAGTIYSEDWRRACSLQVDPWMARFSEIDLTGAFVRPGATASCEVECWPWMPERECQFEI